MGSMEPLVLNFFLRTRGGYNGEALKQMLDLLIARGLRLITKEEEETYTDVEPGVSAALHHEIDEFLTYQRNELDIHVYHLQVDRLDVIEFRFELFLQAEEVICYTFAETFMKNGDLDTVLPLLTEVYQDLYRAWHPFYGYEEYADEIGVSLSWDLIIPAQRTDYLYSINFFGPELVNTLGRERVLSAPAYKIEELDDGGIFLALARHWKKVADHLGLNTPQAPGRAWDEWGEDEWDGDEDEDEDEDEE